MKDAVTTAVVLAALAALFGWAAWEPDEPDVQEPAANEGPTVIQDREPAEGECPNTCKRISLPTGVAEAAGLELVTTEMRPLSEILEANAETRFPPDKYVRVAPRLPGVIREVKAVIGRSVAAGDVLAVIESAEFGRLHAERQAAAAVLELRQKTFDREKELFESRATSQRAFLEAETALAEAKLEFDRADQALRAVGDGAPMLSLVAPIDGVVAEATAVVGEMASTERALFCVADLSRLWISIDVYESDLARVAPDARVTFTVDGLPGVKFPGRVIAVGAEVDDRTRTVRVHADVKNVRGLLRANMFGRAAIRVEEAEPRLVLPREALQNDGDCWLVFVSPVPNIYQARKVEPGLPIGAGIEIAGGLAAGERVVTTGSFLLKTEVLRGQIGAG